jgi:hypothetical protein
MIDLNNFVIIKVPIKDHCVGEYHFLRIVEVVINQLVCPRLRKATS